jgi:hypothetical protein
LRLGKPAWAWLRLGQQLGSRITRGALSGFILLTSGTKF